MHKAQSAPHLLSFSFGDQSDPAVNNDEEYDGTYATANLPRQHQKKSSKHTLHNSDSQTLRRELKKQGDALDSVCL